MALSASVETVTLEETTSGDSIDVAVNSGTVELDVQIKNPDADLSDNTYEITGPDGQSLEIASGENLDPKSDVVLSNSGSDIGVSASGTPTKSLSLVDAQNAGTHPQIDKIEILVTQAPGASDIDMAGTTISFVAPDGSHQLTHSEDSLQEDSTFTLTPVQDEDGTIPVMTAGDRFLINIDPGTLEAGTTSTLEITTPAGATKSLQVRVPDSLANQESVTL
jgi:flagellin FlaB